MKLLIRNMCFATLMLVVCGMSAQKYNEQVMVVAPYKPSVPESYKINVNPQVMVDTNVVKQKADVDILSRRVGTSFDVEEIKAAKVSGEPINKLYNGHIKAGIGNYLTPYLDAFYNSGRNRNHAYGIEYKHLSSAGQKLKDYTLVEHNNSTDKANAFGRLFYDKFTLGGELYFDREMVHMYGLNDSLKPADYDKTTWNDASKRAYTTAGFRADLTSHNTEPDAWFYKLMFDYSYWQSNWKMKQHNPHLTLDFGKNHQWFEQLDEQKYGLLFDLDFYNTDPVNADKYSDLLFKLQPYAKVNWGDFEFFAALKFNVMNDTMTSMTVNPAVEIKWHGVPNVFDVYLGLTGDVQKNSMSRVAKENPFLSVWVPINDLGFSKQKYSFYGGINTSLSKRINLNLQASVEKWEDMLVFGTSPAFVLNVPDPAIPLNVMPTEFLPYTMNTNLFKLQADINYIFNDNFSATLMGRYNKYSEDVPYKPAFEGNLQIRYAWMNKIIIKTEFFAYSELFSTYQLSQSNPGELEKAYEKGAFDWSLSGEYIFNKHWSAFLNLNNLLNQRYYQWYDYPSYRMNFVVGATYSF